MRRSFGNRRKSFRQSRRRSSGRGSGISLLFTIGLVIFAGWVFVKGFQFIFSSDSTISESATLEITRGRVKTKIAESPDWVPALSGQDFLEGDRLRTESGTQAALQILGKNTVFLDEDTEISLKTLQVRSSGKKEVVLELVTGQAWIKVSPDDFSENSKSKFLVESPSFSVDVKGTAFNLESTPIQDVIQLLKGQVEIAFKNPENPEETQEIKLGVGQKLVGHKENYIKLSQNQDIIEIVDNSFMESPWNLSHFEQFFPEDAQAIKQRIESKALKATPSSVPENPSIKSPVILTPEADKKIPASEESLLVEGSVEDNTYQVIVNGYTLTKYIPGSRKWQYLASQKFGTLVPGENTFSVIAVSKTGESSAPSTVKVFYEAAGGVPNGNTLPQAPLSGEFLAPKVTSPALFQLGVNETYQTSAPIVTFSGNVDPKTNAVEVNGFKLKKFNAGDTEFSYIANANYGNMKEGENIYTITAFGPDGKSAATSIKVFYSPLKIGE